VAVRTLFTSYFIRCHLYGVEALIIQSLTEGVVLSGSLEFDRYRPVTSSVVPEDSKGSNNIYIHGK
jgi:hypothetical protein